MKLGSLDLSWRFVRVWQRHRDVYFATWKTNLLPQLAEPFLYVAAFGFGLGALVGEVEDAGVTVTYLAFVAPGMVGMAMLFQGYFEGTYSSYVRMYYQKTFAAQMSTPLSVEDVILGEISWAASKSLLSAGLMTSVLTGLGLADLRGLAVIVPLAVAAGVLFASLGLIITSVAPSIDFFNIPYVFVFSGTFFPVDRLPAWGEALASVMPLTHVVEVTRAAFLARPLANPALTIGYLAGVTPVLALIALIMMKRRLVP